MYLNLVQEVIFIDNDNNATWMQSINYECKNKKQKHLPQHCAQSKLITSFYFARLKHLNTKWFVFNYFASHRYLREIQRLCQKH